MAQVDFFLLEEKSGISYIQKRASKTENTRR